MKSSHQEQDPGMDRFFTWLSKLAVQPKPDFLQRTRQRLLENSEPADQLLDQLLKMDESMRNPQMVHLVRHRLAETRESASSRSLAWFSWLAPLAAAATLTLAFVSFQSRAPREAPNMALQTDPGILVEDIIDEDSELTRIFALAANLHSSADMSQLQSVEDLASLFD
jgi:hypothetical protein